MTGWSRLPLSLPVPPSDWHPICRGRLTSLSDLSAHKLPRRRDARAVGHVHHEGLQPAGGRRGQVRRAPLRETRGHHVEARGGVQPAGQQVPEAAVAAGDEHVPPVRGVHRAGVPDVPQDGGESGQQHRTGYEHVRPRGLPHKSPQL